MGYKWRPSRAQKQAYKERMQEKESMNTYTTPRAIREGCYVKYYNTNKGEVIEGTVTNSSYGASKGQHTFTIDGVMVKGRNLYPNILKHIQGEESIKLN